MPGTSLVTKCKLLRRRNGVGPTIENLGLITMAGTRSQLAGLESWVIVRALRLFTLSFEHHSTRNHRCIELRLLSLHLCLLSP